jgi:D-threo-aldose 1-dehydrogenase
MFDTVPSIDSTNRFTMTNRRHFLRNAALGGLAGATSLLVPRAFAAEGGSRSTHDPDTLPANPGQATGYRPPAKYGAGGTQLGNMFFETSDDTGEAMLQVQWDAGVRYFDTSPWYGLGLSERRLGHFLDGQARGDYVLSSKVGRLLTPDASMDSHGIWAGDLNFNYRYDYTSTGVRRSVEDSLQRLGVPSLDIVFIHDLAPSNKDLDDYDARLKTAIEGAMPELTKMRDEGLIKGWGMGVNDIEPSLAALDNAEPNVILQATRYNLMEHEDALERLFPKCEAQGCSVVIGAPLGAGFLAGKDRWLYGDDMPEGYPEKRARISEIAKQHGTDLRTAALQFTAAPKIVSATIPGARDAKQARENAASMRATIDPAFWQALKDEGLIAEAAPTALDTSA